jgi:hypothetical protein
MKKTLVILSILMGLFAHNTKNALSQIRPDNNLQQIQQQLDYEVVERYFPLTTTAIREKKAAYKRTKNEWKKTIIDIALDPNRDQLKKEAYKNFYDERYIIDSTYRRACETIFDQRRLDFFGPFPSFNSFMSMLHYNETKQQFSLFTKNDLGIGITGKRAAFESEIVSGYISVFRFGISTTLTKNEQETIAPNEIAGLTGVQIDSLVEQKDSINRANSTLQKIIANGGELNVKINAPLLRVGNLELNKFQINTNLIGQFSLDVPQLGQTIPGKELGFFNLYGIENKLIIQIHNFKPDNPYKTETAFRILLKYNLVNIGGSSSFYQAIGINEERFWNHEYAIGLNIDNVIIAYNGKIFGMDKLNDENSNVVSVTLIKKL